MIIKYKCENGKLTLFFTPEKADPITQLIRNTTFNTTRKVEMGSNHCVFELPSDWTMQSVHPDVFALAVLAAIYPFCGPRVYLPQGVSVDFHNQVKKVIKKQILPVDKALSPRKAPSNAVPALTYSGGIDSTAAALLLPENTHLFYFDRLIPEKGIKTLLDQEAAYYACNSMVKAGRTVHKIKTDMQYIRNPVGFNSYLADAVPVLLLADYYGFDTVGHGQTLEIGYQVGHLGFKDCKETEVGYPWFELLYAIDMPYTLPTIGLSEVSTTNIVRNSPFQEFAQACSRGKVKKPCMNCFKCFRKSLLEKVSMNSPLDDHFLDQLFAIKEVQRVIVVPPPIYFSNILAYVTSHYKGNHKNMLLLKKITRGDRLEVDWMRKWYPKSQEFIAPKYHNKVKKEILKYAEPMNTRDIRIMQQSFSVAYFQNTK